MSNLLKNLLIALTLAILLWAGYVFLLPEDEDDTFLPSTPSADAAVRAQQFVVRLAELESMRVDTAVLTDMKFSSFVNFRQDIGVEPFGRKNPFAPVE